MMCELARIFRVVVPHEANWCEFAYYLGRYVDLADDRGVIVDQHY